MKVKEILEEIFKNPSDTKEHIKTLFENKIDTFTPNNEKINLKKYPDFEDIYHIGNANLKDSKKVAFFTIKVNSNLSERESKRKQYELAKEILSLDEFIAANAGIFVFYDKNGNFRMSLIFKVYQGKKAILSHYKRYTHFVSKDKTNRTFIKNFEENDFNTFQGIKEAFSEKELTEEFYKEIQNWYAWALKHAKFPSGMPEENLLRLLTRMIFVWFLKEMKLIPEEIFDEKELQEIVKDFKQKDHYYNAILQNLFFATLNRPIEERQFATQGSFLENRKHFGVKNLYRYEDKLKITKEEFIKIFEETPFVNGGLFECLDKDNLYIDGFSRNEEKRAKLPDFLFFSEEREEDLSHFYGDKKKSKEKVKGLINILKEYNFTADESSPIDIEVSLDPELLGHIFESLLATISPDTGETVRKITGSYYTPKEIVDFMVEESVLEYLKTNTNITEDKLRQIVSYQEEVELSDQEKEEIVRAIDQIKIIDPAVGSGAFPMGILHKLVYILSKIDKDNKIWKKLQTEKAEEEVKIILQEEKKEVREELFKELNETFDESLNYPDYARKLYLIQNSIYGVDIQPIAIQITKLRFFLSLIIDQKVDKNKENFGIRPLPYLETKFVAANTLIGLNKSKQKILLPEDIKQLKKELKWLYKRYFNIRTRTEKLRIVEKAGKIKEKLAKRLKEAGFSDEDIDKIIKFDIFDQTAKADWFDPEWMFGVEDGFDIVIGNPPHGSDVSKIKGYIEKNYSFYETRKNSASLFIEKGFEILKTEGILAYIVPKSLTFVKSWEKPRKLILEDNQLLSLIDITQAFENVRLEQVIFICKKKKPINSEYKFKVGDYWGEKIKIISFIDTNLAKSLDILPIYIDDNKLAVYKKMKENSIYLGEITKTFRGLPYQKKVLKDNSQNGYPVLRGSNIKKFSIVKPLDKINLSNKELNDEKVKKIMKPKIVSQNIVAHITKPTDRILIMATYDKEGLITLDTVMNTFLNSDRYSYEYILGILNSRLAEWFYYWFIYNRAIRTMHFDEYYIGRLPIKEINHQNQHIAQQIESLVNQILNLTQSDDYETNPAKQNQVKELEKQIDQLVYQLYNLTEEEIKIIEGK
ncbi:MAG: type II restriction endonuclease [Sulfurihydrogenibium sp.]|nr:MAG: type II restriction endonuclease [Sulfurihydrogenibium sp.]